MGRYGSEVGFHCRAIVGPEFAFAPNNTGTIFDGMNFGSAIPFGWMPSIVSEPVGVTTQIQSDDLKELLAGARANLVLSGGPANYFFGVPKQSGYRNMIFRACLIGSWAVALTGIRSRQWSRYRNG